MKKRYYFLLTLIPIFLFMLPSVEALDYNENFTVMPLTTTANLRFLEISTPIASNGYRYYFQEGSYSTMGMNHKYNYLLEENLGSYGYALTQTYIDLEQDDVWNETSNNFTSTFTFDNTSIDNLSNWTITETSTATVDIVSERSFIGSYIKHNYDTPEHANLLELKDFDLSGQCEAKMEFQEVYNGSISFWICSSDTSFITFIFLSTGINAMAYMKIDSDKLWINDAGFQEIMEVNDNVWYYILLEWNDFDDTIKVYVDNVYYDTYDAYASRDILYINNFIIRSDVSDSDYYSYLDGLEYSVNHTTGQYNASYNFDHDFSSNPYGWSNVGTPIAVHVSEYYNHSDVLYLIDNNPSASEYLIHDFEIESDYGTIEFWFNTYTFTGGYGLVLLRNSGGSNILYLYVNGGNLILQGASSHTIMSVNTITWYHIRIDIETSTSNYLGLNQYECNLYVNNNLEIKTSTYSNQGIERAFYGNFVSGSWLQYTYFDAIGITWIGNYTIDENFYPTTIENVNEIDDNYFPENSIENNQYYEYYNEIIFGSGVYTQSIYYNMTISRDLIRINKRKESSEFDLNYTNLITLNDITNIEIELHAYFGANENTTYACNTKLIIKLDDIVNHSLVFSMDAVDIPVSSFVYAIDKYFRAKRYNFNTYTNIVEGYRGLCNDDETYHYQNFLEFPSFKESIILPDFDVPDLPSEFHRENEWHYTGFSLQFSTSLNITSTHYWMEFPVLEIKTVDMIHGFDNFHAPFSYGAWYDAFYNALVLVMGLVLNVVNLIINVALFAVILGLNFIVLYVIVGLTLAFLWNIILGFLAWTGLQLLELLFWAITGLSFFFNVLFPLAITWMVNFMAWVFAWIIWGITFGAVDVYAVQAMLATVMLQISGFFVSFIQAIITYLPYMVVYVAVFLEIIFLQYFKWTVCKARGFKNRAEKLKKTLDAYTWIFRVIWRGIKGFWSILPIPYIK